MWLAFLLSSILQSTSSFSLVQTNAIFKVQPLIRYHKDEAGLLNCGNKNTCRFAKASVSLPSENVANESANASDIGNAGNNRRFFLGQIFKSTAAGAAVALSTTQAQIAYAYTPDSDPVKESLYFVSRVQEATVQQERFVNRTPMQEDLKQKMKLTLRLIEKNYKLLDQITFLASYISSQDDVVVATSAGYEAVDALQNAIDYVKTDLKSGPLRNDQKQFLIENLNTCREELFIFLQYVPKDKLADARKRVEEENVLNRDEYDGDGSEGVYNPVVLPWKNQPQ